MSRHGDASLSFANSQEPREDASALAAEEKRRYNREFMRRWRADPRNHAVEREKRRRWYYERHKPRLARDASLSAGRQRQRLCGFCSRLPATGEIARLRVSETSPGGYVQVRIPYCGQC